MKKIKIKISGMHCTSCALSIDMDLEDLEGIKSANTSYAKQITEVEYDPEKITEERILDTIKMLGFTTSML